MKYFDLFIEIGLIAVLVFAPLALGTVQVWSVSWVYFVTFFLVIVWALKLIVGAIRKEDVSLKMSFTDIPILSFLIWAFIFTLRSNILQASWEEFLKIFNYILIYYLVVANLKRKQVRRIALVIVAIGGAIATYGLVQKFQGTQGLIYNIIPRPEQYAYRISGTYICPNHFSGYLEMALSVCLGLLLFSSLGFGWKMFLSYAGLLMGAGIFLSISRGGYLSMAAAVMFLFILGLLKKKGKAVIIFILIAILFSSAIFILNKETILPRWKTVLAESGDPSSRIYFWKGTLEIIKSNPVFGVGPGTFRWHFPRYRFPRTAFDLNYAHNDYLHYAADYGIIGLGLILLFFIALFKQGFFLIKENALRDRAIAGGVLASTVALLVHSIFDFNFHIPANAITFVALAGLMRAGNSITNYELRITNYRVVYLTVGLGLMLVVLFAVPVVVRHYLADREYRKGIVLEKEIRWNKALNFFAAARKIDKDNFLYPAKMADLYLSKSRFSKDKKDLLDKVIVHAKEAIALNPRYAKQYITRALAYEGQGRNKKAEEVYKKALELDPNNAHYYEMLGLFYFRIGEKEKARIAFEKGIQINAGGLSKKWLRKLKK